MLTRDLSAVADLLVQLAGLRFNNVSGRRNIIVVIVPFSVLRLFDSMLCVYSASLSFVAFHYLELCDFSRYLF